MVVSNIKKFNITCFRRTKNFNILHACESLNQLNFFLRECRSDKDFNDAKGLASSLEKYADFKSEDQPI